MSRPHCKEDREEDRYSGSNIIIDDDDGAPANFHDFLPVMLERLGPSQFMEELSKGFRLLMDPITSTITQQSLQRNATILLGVDAMSQDQIEAMLKEGDIDGDGALNLDEFLVLMLRFSPEIMHTAESINLR